MCGGLSPLERRATDQLPGHEPRNRRQLRQRRRRRQKLEAIRRVRKVRDALFDPLIDLFTLGAIGRGGRRGRIVGDARPATQREESLRAARDHSPEECGARLELSRIRLWKPTVPIVKLGAPFGGPAFDGLLLLGGAERSRGRRVGEPQRVERTLANVRHQKRERPRHRLGIGEYASVLILVMGASFLIEEVGGATHCDGEWIAHVLLPVAEHLDHVP